MADDTSFAPELEDRRHSGSSLPNRPVAIPSDSPGRILFIVERPCTGFVIGRILDLGLFRRRSQAVIAQVPQTVELTPVFERAVGYCVARIAKGKTLSESLTAVLESRQDMRRKNESASKIAAVTVWQMSTVALRALWLLFWRIAPYIPVIWKLLHLALGEADPQRLRLRRRARAVPVRTPCGVVYSFA